jgi:hypothetical protein
MRRAGGPVIIGGRYQIRQAGVAVGEERFKLLGHAIESHSELGTPVAVRQSVRIVLDAHRAPTEAELGLELDGQKMSARFRIDRAGGTLRALAQPPVGASLEKIIVITEDMELWHASPVFALVTAGRVRLRPGERREVPVASVQMPSLLPELIRMRWQRLPDVELAHGILAADYVVTTVGGANEIRFQANLLGLPLRMRICTPDADGEFVLLE